MNQINTQNVYNMQIACQLIAMGYKMVGTLPNPNNPKLTMWIFKVEGNFEADFEALRSSRCRKGGV